MLVGRPQLKKITNIHFPITLESKDWEKRKKMNSDKKAFSTLFKVKFYKNENGFPGKALTYDNIVFRATEKMGNVIAFPEVGGLHHHYERKKAA